MTIIVTGASGFIGTSLVIDLLKKGHQIKTLSRTDLTQNSILVEKIKGSHAIINLAGAPVAGGRWTEKRKKDIYDSRINTTKQLVLAIQNIERISRPSALISASAIGFYGEKGQEVISESSSNGQDFLAHVTRNWENEALKAHELGLRVVLPRFGIVLGKNGGALSKMAPVILGSGDQWMSWIHIQDIIEFINCSLENTQVSGPFNLVSPNPITNKDFTKELGKIKKLPVFLKVPQTLLKLTLGEMSSILLQSQRVIPEKLERLGFKFKLGDLNEAFKEIFN